MLRKDGGPCPVVFGSSYFQNHHLQAEQGIDMSTISSVTSNNDLSSLLNSTSAKHKKGGGKIGEDFDSLQKALTSGDLSAAKTALATLQTDMKNGPKPHLDSDGSSSVSGTSGKPKGPDLSALQSALDSGDLSAAKSALADLMKNAPKPHRHRGEGTDATAGTSSTDATTALEAFLQSLQGTSTTSSTSSTASTTTSSDPFGISGKNVDVQA